MLYLKCILNYNIYRYICRFKSKFIYAVFKFLSLDYFGSIYTSKIIQCQIIYTLAHHLSFILSSFIQLVNFYASVITTPLQVTFMVHGDIQGKIMSCWFLLHRDVEFTLSLLSEVSLPTGKAIDFWGLATGWWHRWVGKRHSSLLVRWRNLSDYSHSLAGRSMPLTGVYPLQCTCSNLEPCVRVGCRPWTSTVPHPNSPE